MLRTRPLHNQRASVGRQRPGLSRKLLLQSLEARTAPAVFTVTNTADGPVANPGDLPGSLRQAIFDANANPGADTIDFDASFNVAQVISLAGGQFAISDSLTITGPGSAKLTVDAGTLSRHFLIDGTGTLNVSLSGMTLTNGQTPTTAVADRGGSIVVQDEVVNISDVVFQGNKGGGRGGAISLQAAPGVLNISNSQFLNNSTFNTNISGGAINLPAGTLNLTNCTLSGNSSALRGGAIYQTGGSTTITGTTFDNSSGAGNSALAGGGGQICALAGTVTIANSTLANGTANGRGGAAYFFNAGPAVTITGSTIRDNLTLGTSSGGGINILAGTLTVRDSTIKGNTTNARAGGIYVASALALIERCTIQSNSAGTLGGGIAFVTNGNNSVSTVRNSTITGNTATTFGGGIDLYLQYGFVRIQNSTIVGNTALGTGGGGIARHGGNLIGTAFLESTIVAGNTNAAAPDVSGIFAANFNLVQNPLGATLNGTGNLTGVDPLLGPLQNNGGTTETFLPGIGSPAINAGANTPAGVPTDQRGQTRSFGQTDIGSVEVTSAGVPTAAVTLTNVTLAGNSNYTFTVDYTDDVGIDTITLGDTDVRVTGPGGYDQLAKLAGFTTKGLTVTATYTVPAPGGTFDGADFGTYTVSLEANQVTDTTAVSVPTGPLGQFAVDVGRTLVVVNTADSGAGSLRQAIIDAAATLTPDTITFDPAVFSTPQTITLATTINLNTAVTINGPGTGLLTVSGNDLVRVFLVNAPARPTIAVNNMTLAKGRLTGNLTTDRGAAAFMQGDETVSFTNIVFSGNKTLAGRGGAIGINGNSAVTVAKSTFTGNNSGLTGGAIHVAAGSLAISASTFTGNSATGAGGAISGITAGTTTVTDTVISGNTSNSSGGGIYINAAGLTVERSTVSANKGTVGGGIALVNGAAANAINIRNSTISGNTATAANGGGGISMTTFGMTLNLQNSTVAFNTATTGKGGGLSIVSFAATPGTINLASTIVAKNIATTTGNDVEGQINKASNSLFGDSIGVVIIDSTANITDIDPELAPLALNQGLTPTHAISPTSPAKDTGSNVANLGTDQRGNGFSRKVGLGVDIGAYELHDAPASFVVTTLADSGPGSLRDAILAANSNVSGIDRDTITFDPGLTGTIVLTGGELAITDGVIITGLPGGALTVSGNNASRIFNIDDGFGSSTISVTISNLTLTSGSATGDGGAIFVQNESLTLESVVVSNSKSDAQGGGIGVASNGSVTLRNSTVSGNAAPTVGPVGVGGYGGGIYFANNGDLTIENSTISGNSAAQQGGGVYFFGKAASGTLFVRNSTVSGNTAGTDGGGLLVRSFTGELLIQNSTVAFNTATAGSGGGVIQIGTTGTISLVSSIVAKNVNATAPDVAGNANANFSLVGDVTGSTLTGANNVLGVDPLLGALANNGGPTATHALLAGSPARNAGSNPAGLTTDQRGGSFFRTSGSATDIGAFEVQAPPTVSKIEVNGGAVQRSRVTTITITFDSPVNLPGNPADAFQLIRQSDNAVVTLAASVLGNTVTLTFTGGAVDANSLADGRYTLTALANQITGPNGQLDGNGDGTGGDNFVLVGSPSSAPKLYRLFGDLDADNDVDTSDFAAFRAVYGGTSSEFDFDNDGDVDTSDFGAFRARFGATV